MYQFEELNLTSWENGGGSTKDFPIDVLTLTLRPSVSFVKIREKGGKGVRVANCLGVVASDLTMIDD